MKKLLSLSLTIMLLQGVFGIASMPVKISAQTQEAITNQLVIDLAKKGVSDAIITARINSSKTSFDTSNDGIQQLKQSGVSDSVILAMIEKSSSNNGSNANQNSGSKISVVIPDGTEIKVETIEELSSKKLVEGDPVTFRVVEDLKINGATVIAKGAMVKGTVSSAKKKGMMGRGGNLSVRIESTQTVDDQKIKLRASKSGEGGDNMGSTVALTVLFGPIGLLRKGKDAVIKTGTIMTAYTDEAKTVMAVN